MNGSIIFANEYMLDELQNLKKINDIIKIRVLHNDTVVFVCNNNGIIEDVCFTANCIKWRIKSWDEVVFGEKWICLKEPLLSFSYDEESCYMDNVVLKFACCRALSMKGAPCDVLFGDVGKMIDDLSKYYPLTRE